MNICLPKANGLMSFSTEPGPIRPRLLDANDVAEILNVHRGSVDRLCREGKLRFVPLVGRSRRFDPEYVELVATHGIDAGNEMFDAFTAARTSPFPKTDSE